MIKELNLTFEILEKINNSTVVKNSISTTVFKQRRINLKEAKIALENYAILLKSLEQIDSAKNIKELLAKVHIELMIFIKDISEIDELLAGVIRSLDISELKM